MLTKLPAAIAAMGQYHQFVLYKLAPSQTKPGKTEKMPVDWRTGQLPEKGMGGSAIWTSFANVAAVASIFGPGYGVGFSFAASDPFWFLDIDNCLQPDNTWSPLALSICAQFPGAAMEVSQSGRGLHLFGTGRMPEHGCKNTELGLELYHEGRFVALTGTNALGNILTDHTASLARIVPQYFPPSPVSAAPADWTDAPCAEWRGPADDDELIRRMLASTPSAASVFGNKATVVDLWDGNVEAIARSYPATGENQAYGASEADAALCQHLAFWTGKDCERMARLMRRSALARDKYDRDDYIQRTVLKACSISGAVYQEKKADIPSMQPDEPTEPSRPNTPESVRPLVHKGRFVEGSTIIDAAKQLEMWQGHTYVADANIVLTATGQQLGPDQFKNFYGGNSFVIDNSNGKMTTNAWEAFTQSQAIRMPKVDHMAFRPDLDPSETWRRDGATFVNSYRRLDVPRVKGDVSLFLQHLAKVLPVQRDRDILLSYMAALVQYPGVKFQWAPIIQGMPGNGKSLFSWCVQEAVGARYTHIARPSEIAEKFNDWLVGKIFIGVEDVYYPEGRAEIIETLKPMVTNKRQPIRAMRMSERTVDICANFIINSNHKDALRKTAEDRRWCVMYCAQQEVEHLARDNMDKAYFSRLYGWLNKGGYANVTDFLYSYEIPAEFGLDCLLSRAPETSSTEEAIAASLGRVEQEVFEAIHSGEPGFNGGWVSSLALDKLLKEQRMDAAMPRAKRRDMMKALGFGPHPAFRDGRCTTVLPGTTTRPILYLKLGHWAEALKTGAEVMKAYVAAQMPGAAHLAAVNEVAA